MEVVAFSSLMLVDAGYECLYNLYCHHTIKIITPGECISYLTI